MIINLNNSDNNNGLSEAQKGYTTILALEGKDDCAFVEYFYYKELMPQGLVLINLGGIDKLEELKKYIGSIIKAQASAPCLYKLAIIPDADTNFESVCVKMRTFVGIPALAPATFGFVPKDHFGEGANNLCAGYFVLPDNASTGGLETLTLQACCQDPYKDWATEYIEKSKVHCGQKYRHHEKRIMQAYLASQQANPPKSPYLCNGIGYAVQHKVLQLCDTAPLDKLKSFLDKFMALPKDTPHG